MKNKTFIIAEIGINHNGDIELAKKLIDGAVQARCDAVKFQKRTIDVVYTPEELKQKRESPWGTTNSDQKNGLEFTKESYDEIDKNKPKVHGHTDRYQMYYYGELDSGIFE